MWIVYVIISMFICGILNIIEKKGSNKQPLYFWAQASLIYGLLNIVIGLIFFPKIIMDFNFKTMLLTLPVSFLIVIGYYCSVKALNMSSISQVASIMKSKVIVVLILSIIFLNDKINIIQIVLIFLLLTFNILLNYRKDSKKSKEGIIYAFGFLIANGTATFLNKVVLNTVPDPISITFYTGLTTVISIIIMLLVLKKIYLLNIKDFKNKKYVFIMELLEVITSLLLKCAMIEGNVTIITAMTSCSIIITILLSKLIFKEKISFTRWLILIVIIICLVLLSLLSI